MRHAQEKLVLKCEETLHLNITESFPSSTDTPSPNRARTSQRSDAGSILWDTVDKNDRRNDSEPDDDYTTCEKMVDSYIADPKADRHSSPLQFWKKKINYRIPYLQKVPTTLVYYRSIRKTIQHSW